MLRRIVLAFVALVVLVVDVAADLPVRISWPNTARQRLPRSGVLEPSLDPTPDAPSVMSHASFAFFAAAGHTSGSQVFVAHVRGDAGVRRFVFTGDVVNQIDGARQNLPKPRLYSLLMVPEHTERLARLRALLGALEREHGATLLVSHDQLALEASGVPGG